MSKVKEVENNIEVIAGQIEAQQMLIESIIVEAIRTKAMDEAAILTLITKGMDTFQASKNMTKHEAFGAVGTLTSALDMIKRAKDAGIIR